MLHHTGNKVIRHLSHAAAVGVFTIRRIKQIAPGFAIRQRHVVVRAAASAISRWLGHKAGKAAMLSRNLVRHQTEEHQAVSHAEGIGIGKVGFKLAVGIFMVKGVNIPAHGIHRFDQLTDDGHVVHQAARVVAGFGQRIAGADRFEAAVLGIAKQEKLGLDTQVEGQPHVRRLRDLTLKDIA